MVMVCPFCLKEHELDVIECPKKKARIPLPYVDAWRKKVPCIFLLTIGIRGHGKTTLLSSLFFSLYNDLLARVWPAFSFLGLTQQTLLDIQDTYILPLQKGDLPPATDVMFKNPLIMQFKFVPLRAPWYRGLFSDGAARFAPREVLFVMYDVGGERYALEQRLDAAYPILERANPLLFLIDLAGLVAQSEMVKGPSPRQAMHNLLNNIHLGLTELGLDGQKELVVCFTKQDLMSSNPAFGPLGRKLDLEVPSIRNMDAYVRKLEHFSDEISAYIQSNYSAFHNVSVNCFKNVHYTALSALGSKPEDNKIAYLEPSAVFTPIFWSLKVNGLL